MVHANAIIQGVPTSSGQKISKMLKLTEDKKIVKVCLHSSSEVVQISLQFDEKFQNSNFA